MKVLPAVALTFLALSSAAAQAPTAQQLSRLRLHDGFTLVYQVTVRDVRTPGLRAKDAADQQTGIGKMIAAGQIAKSMRDYYEKQALELGALRPVEQFSITLSGRDDKLLYLSTRGATDKKRDTKTAIVLDAEKEYEVDGKTSAMINNDGWRNAPMYAGENVDRLAFCPLPGVGLPGVDLIRSPLSAGTASDGRYLFAGQLPRLNLLDGDTPYKSGSLEAALSQGRLKVITLTVGSPALPQQVCQIRTSQLFQGHWVGTQMRLTGYQKALADASETLSSDLPTYTADYRLVEAQEKSLAAPAFDAGSYLAPGARVFDDSTGSTFAFTYDARGGTLKEQEAKALKKESEKGRPIP